MCPPKVSYHAASVFASRSDGVVSREAGLAPAHSSASRCSGVTLSSATSRWLAQYLALLRGGLWHTQAWQRARRDDISATIADILKDQLVLLDGRVKYHCAQFRHNR